MGELLTGLLGCIPRFQTAVLETGGIVNLIFKIQIKVLVLLWKEVFCVTTVYVQCSAERILDVCLPKKPVGFFYFLLLVCLGTVLENLTCFRARCCFFSMPAPPALPRAGQAVEPAVSGAPAQPRGAATASLPLVPA